MLVLIGCGVKREHFDLRALALASAVMSSPGRQPPDVRAVAALADPVRRSLFDHVREAGGPVTRETAADAVGISRKLAAFHLDKLVAAGLLEARTADGGRGLGRRPKVYAPSRTDVRVAIPPRCPDLLAELLVAAVRSEGPGVEAALRAARSRGTADGAAERSSRTGRLGTERALGLAQAALERLGFEPVREGGTTVALRNCPFHPIAERDPDLVCGMNEAYVGGLLEGLEARTLTAVLAPRPGGCCIRVAPAAP